jgi:hypothetical protein
MNTLAFTYGLYLVLSIGLTIWVARTLHRNGRAFLIDAFHGNEALADSVNHLLVVGFYLVNLGYDCMVLKIEDPVNSATSAIEALAPKIGMVLLVLGAMHFFNLAIFNKLRNHALADDRDAIDPQDTLRRQAAPPYAV